MSSYEDFQNMLYDFNLNKVVEVPTRLGNTIDLFLTSNPSLVNRVITLPGLSDHEAVLADVSITPKLSKFKKLEVHNTCFKKQTRMTLKYTWQNAKKNLMANTRNKTLNEIWDKFKNNLQTSMSKFVPTKTLRNKRSLPWITQDVLRSIRKRDHLHKKQKKVR